MAAAQGAKDMMELLERNKANANIKNNEGKTPSDLWNEYKNTLREDVIFEQDQRFIHAKPSKP